MLRILTVWFAIGLILFPRSSVAETPSNESLTRLSPWDVFTKAPKTMYHLWDHATDDSTTPIWLAVGMTTGALFAYDDEIFREVRAGARHLGVSNEDKTKAYLKYKKIDLFRGPADVGSALYFLGDGWTHMSIMAGFVAYGFLKDETRPFNTGLELLQGLSLATVTSQILKRATGREDPYVTTAPRGAWNPFPSIKQYNTKKTSFDAYPSGHIMVTTLTFTVIRANYPEYDSVLFPVQIAWSTALALQMINNGVHWASDYPLGVALGYFFGKAVLDMPGDKTAENKKASVWKPMLFPSVGEEGLVANALWSF